MEEKTDNKKIIKLDSYRPNIRNSPLLQGSDVEIKEYSKGLNTLKKENQTTSDQKPDHEKTDYEKTDYEKPKTDTQETKKKWPDSYSVNPPSSPPPPQYDDDNIEGMSFSDSPPEPEPDTSDLMSPTEAKAQATMMINMYSAFVPPMLTKALKKDVDKVSSVMKFNNVPIADIRKIEHFLNTKNSEIAKALQLTKEQVAMLKQALAAVLERYKLSSDNPVVNLIIIVFGIAITQYMAVNTIIQSQYKQIKELIEARNLSAPDGYEDFATPQGFFKRKVKKAA